MLFVISIWQIGVDMKILENEVNKIAVTSIFRKIPMQKMHIILVIYCNCILFRHLLIFFNVSFVSFNFHAYLLLGTYYVSFVIGDNV